MNIDLSPAADLNETAFLHAVLLLNAEPSEVSIVVPDSLREVATRLADQYGTNLIFVPVECVGGKYSWRVSRGADMVYSDMPA